MSESTYAVGRGKPPLHTRFQKGRSGNPSGKPGPAKLAKQRFERALLAALDGSPQDQEPAVARNWVAAIAQRMVLDAGAGKVPAQRLILSVLDAGCREEKESEDFSLVQGKEQGSDIVSAEELLRSGRSEEELARLEYVLLEKLRRQLEQVDLAREQYAAVQFSLVQGKRPGNNSASTEESVAQTGETAPAADAASADGAGEAPEAAVADEEGRADALSQVQGKKQGKENPDGHAVAQPAYAQTSPPANSLTEGISQGILADFAHTGREGLINRGRA